MEHMTSSGEAKLTEIGSASNSNERGGDSTLAIGHHGDLEVHHNGDCDAQKCQEARQAIARDCGNLQCVTATEDCANLRFGNTEFAACEEKLKRCFDTAVTSNAGII